MSDKLRQAAQQALDWLYENDIVHPTKVSQDLRTALEQQQAEPVNPKEHCLWARNGNEPCPHAQQAEPVAWNKSIRDSVDSLLEQAGYQPDSSARHQLAMMNFDATSPQQQAEPVGSLSVRYHLGCKSMTNTDFDYNGDLPEGDYELYTAPPQRKPLTKGEIEIILSRHYMYMEDLIRAVEAAYDIK